MGSRLHQFDLELCRYLLGTVRGYADNPKFSAFIATQVDAPLLACLTPGGESQSAVLLADQDFRDLSMAFEDGYRFDREWIPYVPLHRRAIDCIGEIRESLAIQYADEWATQSSEFALRA